MIWQVIWRVMCGNEIAEVGIEKPTIHNIVTIHDIDDELRRELHNSRHRHQDKGNKCRTQEHLLDRRAVTTTHAAIYETLKIIVQRRRLAFY